jgi:hypothetical protein
MRKYKKHFNILAVIQCLIAIGAVPAGLAFIVDSTGGSMGTTTEHLIHSPFPDFLIPGLFLFIIPGLGNILGALSSFRRMSFAVHLGIFLGIALLFWIVAQVVWIGLTSFLQPLFFIIGIGEAWIGFSLYHKQRKQNLLNRYH